MGSKWSPRQLEQREENARRKVLRRSSTPSDHERRTHELLDKIKREQREQDQKYTT